VAIILYVFLIDFIVFQFCLFFQKTRVSIGSWIIKVYQCARNNERSHPDGAASTSKTSYVLSLDPI
jgi:hypothetical protein